MLKKIFKSIVLFFLIIFVALAGLFAYTYYEHIQEEKQQEYLSGLATEYTGQAFLPAYIKDMVKMYRRTNNKTVAVYQTIDSEYYVEVDNHLRHSTDLKVADINNYKEVAAKHDALIKEILSYKGKNVPYDLKNTIDAIQYISYAKTFLKPNTQKREKEENIFIQILNFIGNNLVYLKWFLIIMFVSFIVNAVTGNLPSMPKREPEEEFEEFSPAPTKKKEEAKKSKPKENTDIDKDKKEEYRANIFHVVEENSGFTWKAYPSLGEAIQAISNKVHPYWIYEQHSFSITDHGVYKNGKKIAEKKYW